MLHNKKQVKQQKVLQIPKALTTLTMPVALMLKMWLSKK
jgi:hypothetical protein